MNEWRSWWGGVRGNTRAPSFWERPSFRSTALVPISWAFAMAAKSRWARAKPLRVSVPVVCVGNLVVGGAGKTPTALAIAQRLATQGHTPHFLTRGYHGHLKGLVRVDTGLHTAVEVGDEPLLLANAAPTWVSKDRRISAQAAIKDGATVLVMDDGFQNPGLEKDVSIIVIDAGFGHGNGRLLPAGPLRERPEIGFARAHAVVMVDDEMAPTTQADTGGLPVLAAHLVPTKDSASRLGGARVIGFCGIGRPEKFFQTLEELECTVVRTHGFPDHHPYTDGDLETLRADALATGARLVTTSKDLARIPSRIAEGLEVVEVHMEFADPAALDAVLAPVGKP
ncbi:MAG: tetraacyldisaccharide 4'-kinase [Alphaproteobacteria bacterium]|nr:tetraacyldisaccharide 4'-kinase [Alphaproteobacteria bacterium]MBT5859819.1 tetraacyldisaccharide 4'-kinase [Alphaproteobacteria bacterium]